MNHPNYDFWKENAPEPIIRTCVVCRIHEAQTVWRNNDVCFECAEELAAMNRKDPNLKAGEPRTTIQPPAPLISPRPEVHGRDKGEAGPA